jgi:hypothetical protein
MDIIVDIPNGDHKVLVCLKEEALHRTIVHDHHTNENNNILKKVSIR